MQLLRPQVPYVTVLQHDSGLAIACEANLHKAFPSLLVLNSGGNGHVPLPLLKQSEPLNNRRPVRERRHVVSYVGDDTHAPVHMRREMITAMEHHARDGNYSAKYYKGDGWRGVMAESRFSLCPRGTGRTVCVPETPCLSVVVAACPSTSHTAVGCQSYHIVEALQMGLVPVHVHLDDPSGDERWVPYELGPWRQVGFDAPISGVKALLDTLRNLPLEQVEAMEARAGRHRASHFESAGVLQQISRFLMATEPIRAVVPGGGRRVGARGSDLVCRALPLYPTTAAALMETLSPGVRSFFPEGFDPACAAWGKGMQWHNPDETQVD